MSRTVLYVDDEPQLPAQVEDVLAQSGYKLIHTADPDEALRIVREEPPALVLTEVLLAGCDGFDLIQQLGRAQSALALPIVVLTRGERSPELYGQAIELGAKDFLCKPVLRSQILEAVLTFARPERADAGSAHPAHSFAGDLADQPLPQLVARLHRSGSSGVLRLLGGTGAQAIQFRNGWPVEVARHRKVQPIGDYLLNAGLIDAEQYGVLLDHLLARMAGPHEILLGMEALSEAQLAAATHEQARSVLLEMFRWPYGQFAFHSGQQLEVADTLELACNPVEIVLAGMAHTPAEVIRGALEQRSELYVSLSSASAGRLDAVGLTREQRSDAESLTGDCSLGEVLATTALDERTLYALFAIGAIQLADQPVLLLGQEQKILLLDQEQQVLLLDQELKVRRLDRKQPVLPWNWEQPVLPLIREQPVLLLDRELKPDEAEDFDPVLGTDVWAEESPQEMPAAPRRTELGTTELTINQIAERIASHDDFAVFGIENTTSDDDVRATYEALVESLSLERIPRELDELRALAAKLRGHIERAYERVCSEEVRQAYAALRVKKRPVRSEEKEDLRAVDAESWFQKGEGFLASEHFGQAVEAFGMSLHLDPGQGDYAAHLGYALYRSNSQSSVIRREALEHISNGVKLSPDREKPLLFLGRIYREGGDAAMAKKVLRRAARINPDCPAVVMELCLIDAEEPIHQEKTLFNRLRGR